MDLSEGDVVDIIAGTDVSQADKEKMREDMGLNDPMIIRYFRYMVGVVKGDMGISPVTNLDVFDVYMSKLPNTIVLAFGSMFVALLISIPLGVIGAVHQNTWMDSGSMVLGLLGISVPTFWLGLLMIIIFSLKLGLFPSGGNAGFTSIILPAFTLGAAQAGLTMRTTRSSMLEFFCQDY